MLELYQDKAVEAYERMPSITADKVEPSITGEVFFVLCVLAILVTAFALYAIWRHRQRLMLALRQLAPRLRTAMRDRSDFIVRLVLVLATVGAILAIPWGGWDSSYDAIRVTWSAGRSRASPTIPAVQVRQETQEMRRFPGDIDFDRSQARQAEFSASMEQQRQANEAKGRLFSELLFRSTLNADANWKAKEAEKARVQEDLQKKLLGDAGQTGDVRFSSEKYAYAITLPDGWIQIPQTELARLKERIPPQAQHLIYDAAFQRGYAGTWFAWPYVIVQVIPPERTNLRRLPTEPEFQQVVTMLSGGRAISKVKEAIDAVQDPGEKAALESLLPSLIAPWVRADVANRKYQFVVDGNDPTGPMNVYISGAFMPDGSVIQLNSYTEASRLKQDLGQFLVIARSLRKAPNL
jgi:hypothetical protein